MLIRKKEWKSPIPGKSTKELRGREGGVEQKKGGKDRKKKGDVRDSRGTRPPGRAVY